MWEGLPPVRTLRNVCLSHQRRLPQHEKDRNMNDGESRRPRPPPTRPLGRGGTTSPPSKQSKQQKSTIFVAPNNNGKDERKRFLGMPAAAP